MPFRSNRDAKRRARRGAVWAFLLFFTLESFGEFAALELRNGERVIGAIVSEDAGAIVIVTPQGGGKAIPLEQIVSRKPVPANKQTETPPPQPVLPAPPGLRDVAKPQPVARPTPKAWKVNARMGLDLINGSKDRELYYGQVVLTYAPPRAGFRMPPFRNQLEYRVDYAETDGLESANRMFGSNKTDWEIGHRLFVYNFMGAGFDEVRKIDLQYEIGPGLGRRLTSGTNFTANAECGLTYQSQEREDSPAVEAVYARVGGDCGWSLAPRITLTQRDSLLTRVDDAEQMQFRMEANLALCLVKDLSFNLTAINLHDTQPAPGVSRNEFQLRYSIGVAF